METLWLLNKPIKKYTNLGEINLKKNITLQFFHVTAILNTFVITSWCRPNNIETVKFQSRGVSWRHEVSRSKAESEGERVSLYNIYIFVAHTMGNFSKNKYW